jgi:putative RecB family exonuclease
MILNEMRFSHSSINCYNACPLSFKMIYIQAEDRMGNAFSDFGSFVHKILEKYFKDELDLWQLSSYYQEHYAESIKNSFPSFPAGMADNYYNEGLEFFEEFDFDKSDYEIIAIEESIQTKFKDFNFIAIPDLLLKHKKSGKYILFDYKTANVMKGGKPDKSKLEDYKRQVHLYAYFLWYIKQIEISEIKIWAIRNGKVFEFPYDQFYGLQSLEWVEETINQIRQDTKWEANTKNQYWCYQICSVRSVCPFINGNQH